jgi:hypothetical protein
MGRSISVSLITEPQKEGGSLCFPMDPLSPDISYKISSIVSLATTKLRGSSTGADSRLTSLTGKERSKVRSTHFKEASKRVRKFQEN